MLRLLVFGGSQGARIMSDIVPDAVARLSAPERARLDVVQQVRQEDFARVRAAYAEAGVEADLSPFFRDLPFHMARSQLVIARAGASTVAEISVIGRPSILVPLPGSLDQDQAGNAKSLADIGAATMLAQAQFEPDALAEMLSHILATPLRLADMATLRAQRRHSRRRGAHGRSRDRGGTNAGEEDASRGRRLTGRATTGARKSSFDARAMIGDMRMKLPNELGPIHFIGIGGIGMSGIAELLKNLDYEVQGSDASDSANVKRLRDKGISVQVGHEARNLGEAAVVVVSTAIKRDNPELVAAREKRLPVVRRAEMLAELMRFKTCVAIAGTHGKTTTTSLVAALLDAGGLDPTVINGGIINSYGTNARMGAGEFMVVEADECDGTFLKLPADVAIVTNIDPEHLDHFQTYDAIKDAFRSFVENVPFYGFAVMCLDHPAVQELVGHITDRRVITYGENPQADVRLREVPFEAARRDSPSSSATARPGRSCARRSRHADAGPSQCAQRLRRHRGRP